MDHPSLLGYDSAQTNGHSYSVTVHQATGMVAVQAMRSVHGAMSLLSDYALSVDHSVEAVAFDVVDLRVAFDPTGHARRFPTLEPE